MPLCLTARGGGPRPCLPDVPVQCEARGPKVSQRARAVTALTACSALGGGRASASEGDKRAGSRAGGSAQSPYHPCEPRARGQHKHCMGLAERRSDVIRVETRGGAWRTGANRSPALVALCRCPGATPTPQGRHGVGASHTIVSHFIPTCFRVGWHEPASTSRSAATNSGGVAPGSCGWAPVGVGAPPVPPRALASVRSSWGEWRPAAASDNKGAIPRR